MYQDHSASSTQIATLKINTSVNILDYYRDSSTKQSWYKVSASGRAVGCAQAMLLSTAPPVSRMT